MEVRGAMSIRTPEVFSTFGTLDSTAIDDGEAADAHLLRTMAMAANRELARGHVLLNMLWDDKGNDTEVAETGVMAGFGPPIWVRLTGGPIYVPKKPGLDTAKIYIRHILRTDEVVYLQIASRATPFNPAAGEGYNNVVKLVGTNAWAWKEQASIPISSDASEEFTFYFRGVPTNTNGNTGTNGTPNSGTVTDVREHDIVVDSGANWNSGSGSNTYYRTGHALLIEDASGTQLMTPRWIVEVKSSTEIRVYPELPTNLFGPAIIGKTYRIKELPRWKLGNIALYAQNRSF
jgi:hypothetical protein